MSANPMLDRLKAGEPTYVFSVRMSRTVNIVSLAEALGYHGLYVDLQHSAISIDAAAQICTTALHSSVTAFARVPSLEPGLIARLLNAGAQGILAPDIRSVEDAEALVRAALVAPRGDRSVAGGIPNPRLPDGSAEAVNEATLLIAMIETEDADPDIAGVEGISAIQIGTNDLTTAMGIPGDYLHARVQAVYRRAIDACRAAGKPLIIGGIREPEALEAYVRMGAARCYFTGTDTAFLLEGARASLARAARVDAAIAGGTA